jgi:hypothetical protein
MLSILREFMSRLNEKETQVIFDFLDTLSESIEEVIDQAGKLAAKPNKAKSRR